MPASDYQHRPGGSLKLKGGAETKKKKKSKSSSTHKVRDETTGSSTAPAAITSGGSGSDEKEGSTGASSSKMSAAHPHKTDAERRFEEVQRKRLLERAAKQARKSHKDRVAEFNEKLENMSEHYDVPRVGPG